MQKEDFLMREIEKMGLVLRAILNGLMGKREDLALKQDIQFAQTREMLLNETGFDFNLFLSMEAAASAGYIAQFRGINTENLELLARITYQSGLKLKQPEKRLFLEKALHLYDLCNQKDKTFSFERENSIRMFREEL